jgi:hypothetical protein
MKIYTKVVIDIKTLEVVSSESYDYIGPLAECKGGGGSSGAVDFPTHMKTVHASWLDKAGTDTIESSVTTIMNTALGGSPFTGASAYDPSTDLTSMMAYVEDLETLIESLSSENSLDSLITTILSDDRLSSLAVLYDEDLSRQLDINVFPEFEAGMRDINSVMSSAFIIGRAIIEDGRVKETAKFLANLRYKAASDDAIKVIGMKLQYHQSLAQLGIEANRIKIVAKSEENDRNLKIDEADAKWDLEVFQYGNNVLASISGASHYVPDKEGSTTKSAIGGALSGAAAGAMVGSVVPGIGTAVGAGVGALMGIGQAFL